MHDKTQLQSLLAAESGLLFFMIFGIFLSCGYWEKMMKNYQCQVSLQLCRTSSAGAGAGAGSGADTSTELNY